MIDKEKILRGAECCRALVPSGDWCPKECPYMQEGGLCSCGLDPLLDDVIALVKEQEPRLLTLDEVTEIGCKERDRTSGEDVNPVWLEETTTFHDDPVTTLYMVLISQPFDFPGDEGLFYAKYFGTDLDEVKRPERYGKLWRCWTAKPSKEQGEATAWN